MTHNDKYWPFDNADEEIESLRAELARTKRDLRRSRRETEFWQRQHREQGNVICELIARVS